MDALLAELGKALMLAIVLPFLTPLLQLIDKSRKHANIRKKLEDIKLLMETESILYDNEIEERKKFYSKKYEEILERNKDLDSYPRKKVSDSTFDYKDPFDLGDIISAIAIPAVLFFLLVLVNPDEEAKAIFAITTISAGIISYYSTKKIICKKVSSGFYQKILAFVVSLLALIPGIFFAVLFEAFF